MKSSGPSLGGFWEQAWNIFLAARDYNPSSKERTLLGTKGKKDINTIKERDVFPAKLLFTSERAQL